MVSMSGQANASDTRNWRSPVFENVERVYLHVSYGMIYGEQDELPEILRRETLEREFLRIYTERFSSKHCKKYLVGKNPYICNDQPVMLVPRTSSWLKRWKGDEITPELAGDDGTLNVILKVYIVENPMQTNPPSGEPIFVYQIFQERPKLDLPIYWQQIGGADVIPMNQTEEKMRQQILKGIESSLDGGIL